MVRVVEEMKKAGVKMLQEEEWQIERELVLKEEKVYVPKNEKLKAEIIQLYHDVPVAGHEERWKTIELVARSDQRCGKIYKGIQYVLENKE